MDIVITRCAGFDVHEATVVATVRVPECQATRSMTPVPERALWVKAALASETRASLDVREHSRIMEPQSEEVSVSVAKGVNFSVAWHPVRAANVEWSRRRPGCRVQ